MKTRHPKVLQKITKALERWGYRVWSNVLNTMDHGVPHSRQRLYLVAILKDSVRHDFEWPKQIPLVRRVKHIINKRKGDSSKHMPALMSQKRLVLKAFRKVKKQGRNPRQVPVLIDVGCSPKFASHGVGALPCLTATRGATRGRGHWCSTVGRHLTLIELFQFQGFTADEASAIMATLQSASPGTAPNDSHVGRMLGNTMSLNVIERVLAQALPAAGLARGLTDPWYAASGAA